MDLTEYNRKKENFEITGTKVLKVGFVFLSSYLLFQNLFGNPPDLLAFYKGLFILSASVLFDGMDDWTLMKKANKDGYKCSKCNTLCIWTEFTMSLVCFGVPLLAVFTRPELGWLYNHINNGNHVWLAFAFMACYVICFLANTKLNCFKPPQYFSNSLNIERRPKEQKA
jgi:hypothetical protein